MIITVPTTKQNKPHVLVMLNSAVHHIDEAKNDLRCIGINISTIDESRLRIEAMVSDVEFLVVV